MHGWTRQNASRPQSELTQRFFIFALLMAAAGRLINFGAFSSCPPTRSTTRTGVFCHAAIAPVQNGRDVCPYCSPISSGARGASRRRRSLRTRSAAFSEALLRLSRRRQAKGGLADRQARSRFRQGQGRRSLARRARSAQFRRHAAREGTGPQERGPRVDDGLARAGAPPGRAGEEPGHALPPLDPPRVRADHAGPARPADRIRQPASGRRPVERRLPQRRRRAADVAAAVRDVPADRGRSARRGHRVGSRRRWSIATAFPSGTSSTNSR